MGGTSEGAPRQVRDTISFVGRCPSTSSGHHFLRGKVPLDKLGTPFPSWEGAPRQARDTISLSEGAPRQARDTISFRGKVPLGKLGTPFPWSEGAPRQARDTISLSEMVEAGGVEPPSEKRYDTKPTCLAQFRLVRPPRSE